MPKCMMHIPFLLILNLKLLNPPNHLTLVSK